MGRDLTQSQAAAQAQKETGSGGEEGREEICSQGGSGEGPGEAMG